MSVRLHAAAIVSVAIVGFLGYLEIDDAMNYQFIPATVVATKIEKCSIESESHYILFRRKFSLSNIECERAEALAAFDPDLKGGDIFYNQTITVRYVDPVDGAERTAHLAESNSRFVVAPGGRVYVRAHKTRAGETGSGRWTENVARAEDGV